MRIIAGNLRGRRLNPPANLPVRPTTDMARESLFNILNNYFYFEAVTVIDLFAGTGNISLEFASREAISVLSVDIHQPCVNFIKKMAGELHYLNLTAIKADAFQVLANQKMPVDIIFADPPYEMEGIEKIPELVFERNLLKPDGWLILEHNKRHDFASHPKFYQHRDYGRVNFTFFVNMTENSEEK